MSAVVFSRTDVVSGIQTSLPLLSADKPVAKVEGLTVDDASELATWLRIAGFHSVEFVHEADQCAVHWRE